MPRYCASEACNQLSTAPIPLLHTICPSVRPSVCLNVLALSMCVCVSVCTHAPHMPSSTYTYACSIHGEKGSSKQSNIRE